MAYNSSTKTISGAVSVHDVQQALNANDVNDVGRLCVHNNVNKWATFKPIKRGNLTPLTKANLYAQGTDFCGLSGLSYFGISFSTFISNMEAIFNNPNNPYYEDGVVYNKPEGGSTSPYRLSDFGFADNTALGYKSDAELKSKQDSQGNWHTFNRWSRKRDATSEAIELRNGDVELGAQPQGYTEGWENLTSFQSTTASNLTTEDRNIHMHDFIEYMWGGVRSATVRHGIMLYDPPYNIWVFVGKIPLDDTISTRSSDVKAKIAEVKGELANYSPSSSGRLHCVEFLTDAPETSGTAINDVFYNKDSAGTHNFVCIPGFIGYAYFTNGGDSGFSFVAQTTGGDRPEYVSVQILNFTGDITDFYDLYIRLEMKVPGSTVWEKMSISGSNLVYNGELPMRRNNATVAVSHTGDVTGLYQFDLGSGYEGLYDCSNLENGTIVRVVLHGKIGSSGAQDTTFYVSSDNYIVNNN